MAGQVLDDVIHGTLEAIEASRRLAGIGVNSTRKNVVLVAESAAHPKQLVSISLPQALEARRQRRRREGPGHGHQDDGSCATCLAKSLSDHLQRPASTP